MLGELARLGSRLSLDLSELSDPLVQKIIAGAAVLIFLVLVLRMIARRREAAAAARARAELRAGLEEVRLRQEEIERLAARIIATSSTSAVAGFTIVRQVETVFSEGQRTSSQAVELLKALAARKGANAIVNLRSHQTAAGKWSASGDAVIVRESCEVEEAT